MDLIPPPKRERNAPETRKRMLDAAELEFSTKGFDGARLREIAAATGVQQALIHHYFDDKEGLYRAVVDRALSETMVGAWGVLQRSRTAQALIEGFVDMLLDFFSSHPNLLGILRMEALSGTDVALSVFRERTQPVVEAVRKVIVQLQKEGSVRGDLPADEMIVAVLSMTIFPFQDARLIDALWPVQRPEHERFADRKRTILGFTLAGIRPHTESPLESPPLQPPEPPAQASSD